MSIGEIPRRKQRYRRLQAVYVIADDQGRVDKATSDSTLAPIWDRNTILSELAQMQQTHKPVMKTIRATDKTPYQVLSSTMLDSEAWPKMVRGGRPQL